MDFVVNEWLPEYYRPQALPEQRLQLETFLARFMERGDRLVVLQDSEFLRKLLRYAKDYAEYTAIREAISKFITTILIVPERRIIVEELLPIPESTHAVLHTAGTNFHSDEYLFHAALHAESRIIVTTDIKLYRAMADDEDFKVVLLEGFLKDY